MSDNESNIKKSDEEDFLKYRPVLYSKGIKQDIAQFLKSKSVVLVGPSPYLEGMGIGVTIDSFDVVVRLKSGYPIPESHTKDFGKRIDLWYTNLKSDQNNLDQHTLDSMEKNGLNTIVFPYPVKYTESDVFRNDMLKLIQILQNNFKTGVGSIQKHFRDKHKKCPFKIAYDESSLYFQMLEKIIGCRPTTGTLAIMDLLQYDIEKLQLVGFTFRHEVSEEQNKQTSNLKLFEGDASKLFNLYSTYYKTDAQVIKSWERTLATKTHDINKELKFIKKLRTIDKRIKIDSHFNEILQKI
jgi:hypothetical protein